MKRWEDKTISIPCPCCGAVVEIHPSHPQYQQLKIQQEVEKQREAHPEVSQLDLELEGK